MSVLLLEQSADGGELRRQWLHDLESLFSDIRAWASAAGWTVEEKRETFQEQGLEPYEAPVLIIRGGENRVYVEPAARLVFGSEGRVDIYGYPTLTRAMLLRKGREWVIRPMMGPPWPRPWSKDAFVELVGLLQAED